MRSVFAAAAFAAIAVANPVPQGFSWEDIDAAAPIPTPTIPIIGIASATTVSFNPSLAASTVAAEVVASSVNKRSLIKRQSVCAAQQAGSGPVVNNPDTPGNFQTYSAFATAASTAPTPPGYVNTFTNLQASNNAYGYMGYTLLDSYDTIGCANKCNAIYGCQAFNVYYERDPSEAPDVNSCPNPPSTTYIKCVFWGGPVDADNAVNTGQWQDSFQVVMAGSNGYVNETIAPLPGYTEPTYLGNAAINAPNDCNGADTYMGVKLFTTGPFDAGLCAAACTAQTEYNFAHPPSVGEPQSCTFFNTYLLLDNGANVGQYCALYNETWSSSYATNTGQWRGSDYYSIAFSYTYSNITDPGTC